MQPEILPIFAEWTTVRTKGFLSDPLNLFNFAIASEADIAVANTGTPRRNARGLLSAREDPRLLRQA